MVKLQPGSGSPSRFAYGTALRIALPLVVFAYLFTRIDGAVVASALQRIPLQNLLAAMVALLGAVGVGAVRWRALLRAYGASTVPTGFELTRLYFVATFYNLLPGAVGGDVLRGYATRGCFPEGPVRAVGVVFVERVLGFTGLLLLAAVASLYSPFIRSEVLYYAMLGLLAAIGAVLLMTTGRHLARFAPERVASMLRGLPVLVSPLPFLAAILLSIASHICVTATGHLLISGIASRVTWADSAVIFPISTLAAYFPLTVAGAGARDSTLVFLFSRIGVSEADALASSLAILGCHLLLGLIGFLLRGGPQPAQRPEPSADALLPSG